MRKKHCVEFAPAEDAEKDWAYFEQLRAGSIDRYQLDKRFFRRDGSLIWGRLSISLLNNRPSSLVVAMVEDISERRTTQEDLLRHAGIVESSQDAIISKSLQGAIRTDRKSTRLNSSHGYISYAVFCLKKKNTIEMMSAESLSCPQYLW